MLVPASSASRRLPAALAALALILVLTAWLGTANAHAAAQPPQPPFGVTVAPSSVTAGSTGNNLVFTFTARYNSNSNVAVTVPTPAGWTAPQNRFPAQPGFVSAAAVTCNTAVIAGIGGGRTITVSPKCKTGQRFTLRYAGAAAPTDPGPYTFVTRAVVGQSGIPASPQPVVTVNGGPAARADVVFSSIPGAAIPGQTVRVGIDAVAQDAYGNPATGFVTIKTTKTGAAGCPIVCTDFLTEPLNDGRGTFNVDFEVASIALQMSAFPSTPSAGTGSIFAFHGAPPDLDAARLEWDPTTQNPDGSYGGHLELTDPSTGQTHEVDPNSGVVSGTPTENTDGTTSVPAVFIDLGSGAAIPVVITLSTSTNTTTGEFAEQTYEEGDELQVMGCDAALETFAELAEPVEGAPPAPECPNGFYDPTVINGNTAYVRTYDGTSQIAVLVGAYAAP